MLKTSKTPRLIVAMGANYHKTTWLKLIARPRVPPVSADCGRQLTFLDFIPQSTLPQCNVDQFCRITRFSWSYRKLLKFDLTIRTRSLASIAKSPFPCCTLGYPNRANR